MQGKENDLKKYAVILMLALAVGSFYMFKSGQSALLSKTLNVAFTAGEAADTPVSAPVDFNPVLEAEKSKKSLLIFPVNETINFTNNKDAGLIDRTRSLGSCETSKKQTRTVNKPITGTTDKSYTYVVEYSLGDWMNSNSLEGTTNSPFTPPCLVDSRDNADNNINFANQYSLDFYATNISGEMNSIAGVANGLVCLATSTRDISQKYSATQLSSGILNKFSTSEEYSVAQRAAVADSIVLPKKSLPDFNKVFQKENLCKGEITSLYNSDIATTGEQILDSDPGEIYNLNIPLGKEILAKAYKDEGYQLTSLGAIGHKIIHRNKAGIYARVLKNTYEGKLPILSYMPNPYPELTTPGSGIKFQQRLAIGGVNQLQQETKSFYFPWLGQIRQMHLRITNLLNNVSAKPYNPDTTFNTQVQPLLSAAANNGLNASYTNGGEVKTVKEKLKEVLTFDLNILYCPQTDSVKNTLEILKNSGTVSKADYDEFAYLVDHTDCVSQDITAADPLQEYLCSQNLVELIYCQGTKYYPKELLDKPIVPEPDPVVIEPPLACIPAPTTSLPAIASPTPGFGVVEDVIRAAVNFIKPINSGARSTVISANHPGIDWATNKRYYPLYAIGNCSVVFAGVTTGESSEKYSMWSSVDGGYRNEGLGGFGRGILLNCPLANGQSVYPAYAHLSEIKESILNGSQTTVSIGEQIGMSGNSGNSSGAHLHFELRKSGGKVPYRYSGNNDPNYYDPTCLLYGTCIFQGSGEGAAQPPVSGPVQICTPVSPTPVPSNPSNPTLPVVNLPYNITSPFTSATQVVTTKCDAYSSLTAPGRVTQKDLAVLNLSYNQGAMTGTRSLGDINKIIKTIATQTCVPAEKLAAHIQAESYGTNASPTNPNAKLEKRYNGTIDQTRNNTPNICGCVGPGQFCPGTISAYFAPGGHSYSAVRSCMRGLGFTEADLGTDAEPRVINASMVGASLCATAVKLKNDSRTGETSCQSWTDVPACSSYSNSEITANRDQCPLYASSRAYLGSCNGAAVYKAYCNQTANLYDPNSYISYYKNLYK